jgi:hypothetical protein
MNARRSLEVSPHEKRAPIRDALLGIRANVAGHGAGIAQTFNDKSVVPSEAVFSRRVHRGLEAIARDLTGLAELHARFDFNAPGHSLVGTVSKMSTRSPSDSTLTTSALYASVPAREAGCCGKMDAVLASVT